MSNGQYRVEITVLVEVQDWEALVQAAQAHARGTGQASWCEFLDRLVVSDTARAAASALQELVRPPVLDVPGTALLSGPGPYAQVSVSPQC